MGSPQAGEARHVRPRDRHAGHTPQTRSGWSERPVEASTRHRLITIAGHTKPCSPDMMEDVSRGVIWTQ